MWNFLVSIGRQYASRYVKLGLGIVVGFVGYNLESWVSDKHTPSRKSAIERREERRANAQEEEFQVPKTIFEKNVSPSLAKED